VLLEQEGKYNEALSLLKAALRQRPGDEDIVLHLVNDDFKTGADHEAIQLAQDSFRKDSNGKTAARLGALLVKNGHFQEAVPMLESAVRNQPPSMELTFLLARAYVGSHSSERAIQLLQPITMSDASGEAAYLLGLAYSNTQQPRQAVEAFRVAADRRPADALAHAQLGSLLLSSRDESDQAAGVAELHKAIDVAPHDGAYSALLGRWLLGKNQEAAALPVLQRGVEEAPPSAELYLLLGIAEASLQSTQLAQQAVEKAIALDPKIALSHDVLGFCYFRIGNYSHAAEDYKAAHDLSPRTGRFAYDTALALERANKPAEAIPYAEKAVSLDPSLAMDHYLLGKLYGKMERKPEAVKELETSIRLDPTLDYPYYLLARMYMRLGDTAKAQEWNLKFKELKKRQTTFHGADNMSSEPRNTISPSILLGGQQMDPEAAAPETEH
jgi:tetratricopeptide (TPR) repeat protein